MPVLQKSAFVLSPQNERIFMEMVSLHTENVNQDCSKMFTFFRVWSRLGLGRNLVSLLKYNVARPAPIFGCHSARK